MRDIHARCRALIFGKNAFFLQAYDEFMARIDALTYAQEPPYDYFLGELRAVSI